jgi:type IV secretory pathway VirB10-like protein
MPISRPILLALIGAVLVGAVFFATRGVGGTSADSDSASTPVTPAPEPDTAADTPAAPKQQKSEPAPQKSEPKQQKSEPAQQKSEPKQQKSEPAQQKAETVHSSRPAKRELAARKHRALSRRTTPAEVQRAIARHRLVILFFRQRGADDDAVAGAVNAQRGRKGVTVFTLPVGQAPKYAKVGASTVVRAPSIVVVSRKHDPLMYEGFIDTATLTQAVTDSR